MDGLDNLTVPQAASRGRPFSFEDSMHSLVMVAKATISVALLTISLALVIYVGVALLNGALPDPFEFSDAQRPLAAVIDSAAKPIKH
jgi:hypothetical protein